MYQDVDCIDYDNDCRANKVSSYHGSVVELKVNEASAFGLNDYPIIIAHELSDQILSPTRCNLHNFIRVRIDYWKLSVYKFLKKFGPF